MQSQRTNQKNTVKKINVFELQNVFFIFFSFWALLLHHCKTFSFFVQIEWFKLLWNCHLKVYKSRCNSKGNRIIYKDFSKGLKICYELFNSEFSLKTTTSGRGCNFLTSNSCLLIFSAIDVQRGEFHLLFVHHKQWGLLAKTPRNLKCKCTMTGLSTLLRIKPDLRNYFQNRNKK
jgi:hypothetical protein